MVIVITGGALVLLAAIVLFIVTQRVAAANKRRSDRNARQGKPHGQAVPNLHSGHHNHRPPMR